MEPNEFNGVPKGARAWFWVRLTYRNAATDATRTVIRTYPKKLPFLHWVQQVNCGNPNTLELLEDFTYEVRYRTPSH